MHDDVEQAIDEFLEGNPRARELAEMVSALEVRRDIFLRERAAAADEQRREWDARLKEVEKQIRVLREEQAVTGFVEGSIRATISRSLPDMDLDESE